MSGATTAIKEIIEQCDQEMTFYRKEAKKFIDLMRKLQAEKLQLAKLLLETQIEENPTSDTLRRCTNCMKFEGSNSFCMSCLKKFCKDCLIYDYHTYNDRNCRDCVRSQGQFISTSFMSLLSSLN